MQCDAFYYMHSPTELNILTLFQRRVKVYQSYFKYNRSETYFRQNSSPSFETLECSANSVIGACLKEPQRLYKISYLARQRIFICL